MSSLLVKTRFLISYNNKVTFLNSLFIYVLVIGLSGVYNHTSDEKVGRPRSGSLICLSRVRLQTELDKVFLPINHENYNFQEKKSSQVRKEKIENCIRRLNKGGVNCLIV